jgi:hypothetical protein
VLGVPFATLFLSPINGEGAEIVLKEEGKARQILGLAQDKL